MDPLAVVNLLPLMARTQGRPEVRVGLIDGPVDFAHPDLASASIREVPGPSASRCVRPDSAACAHGTFTAGILSATRGSAAPALCPGCELLVRSVFAEGRGATPAELAAAIVSCVEAGARLLNLSLALVRPWDAGEAKLTAALDFAAARGVLVIAAAGNQGVIGSSVLTRHPGVLPVAACGAAGRLVGLSNLAASIGRRGLLAPGDAVTSLGTTGRPVTAGGTSVAAAFVTGTAALLWSEFPAAPAARIRQALLGTPGRRRTIVPPLLDAWGAYRILLGDDTPTRRPDVEPNEVTGPEAAPAAGGCGCGPGRGGPPAYVYALGRIEARFPSLSLDKEFAQAAARSAKPGQTDRQAFHAVLSEKANRYLVRRLCWVLTIGSVETYLLQPRDPTDFDLLVEAVRPSSPQTDVDVVVGLLGPVASPEVCNGLQLPQVAFDQVYSFDTDALVKSIPRPEKYSAEQFTPVAQDLFLTIMQLADNAGATDEHRALNYLAVRYPAIYSRAAEAYGKNHGLAGVQVRPSALAGPRRIVDVIFSYTNRQTDVTEKFFVRVDVSEQFPFLVSKLSPYFDR